jgi:thiol-disulfide isomerase/thioredoxin
MDVRGKRGKRGNRAILLLVVGLAVIVAAAGAYVILQATATPEPAIVVLGGPSTAAGDSVTPARDRLADFTVIDPAQPAPQTAFTDESGRSLTLADFRGRAVLLNLWATWCAPCVEEMPALDRLQARLGGPDFAVVALSQDRQGAAVVKPFFADKALTHLTVYLDPKGALGSDLAVRGLPTSVLIDRQGRIVGRLEGPAAWDSPAGLALMQRAIGAAPAG